MRWQDRERGKGITGTPKEGKDEEMESGDTWVCPCVPSLQGWVKVSRQVESWFREGLRTNLTVEGCGSPQLACPWHVPTLPIPLPGWWP